jgi:hypothetical protein
MADSPQSSDPSLKAGWSPSIRRSIASLLWLAAAIIFYFYAQNLTAYIIPHSGLSDSIVPIQLALFGEADTENAKVPAGPLEKLLIPVERLDEPKETVYEPGKFTFSLGAGEYEISILIENAVSRQGAAVFKRGPCDEIDGDGVSVIRAFDLSVIAKQEYFPGAHDWVTLIKMKRGHRAAKIVCYVIDPQVTTFTRRRMAVKYSSDISNAYWALNRFLDEKRAAKPTLPGSGRLFHKEDDNRTAAYTDVPKEIAADEKERDRLLELINFPLIGDVALRFDLPRADDIRIEGEGASQIDATLVRPLVPNKTLIVGWDDLSQEDERERDLILVGVLLAFAVGTAIEAIRPWIAIIDRT